MEGNGSLYCTVPASTSAVNGGFVGVVKVGPVVKIGFVGKGANVERVTFVGQEEDVRKAEKLPLDRIRSMGVDWVESNTFGPSEAIKGCTERSKLPPVVVGAVGAM